MSVLNYQSPSLLALLAVSVLAACGGGSPAAAGSAGNDPSDKYVGTWKRCTAYNAPSNGFLAYGSTLSITKVATSTYRVTSSNSDHTDALCASAATLIVGESGTIDYTIVGSKAASGVTVDLVTYAGSGKSIVYVNAAGTTLQEGGYGGLDASGYPISLNTSPFTKQ